MADGKFDDLLLGLASKHKNVEELSYSVLSFFERRTDLFHVMETSQDRMGFQAGAAEKMVLKHFRFFQRRYIDRCQPHLVHQPAEGGGAGTGEPPSAGSGEPPDVPEESGSSSSTAQEPVAAEPILAPADAAAGSAASGEVAASQAAALPESTLKMMKHISTWNGAVTDKYYWSQSIAEVTLEIEVEQGCTAKEIKLDLTPTRLTAKCQGNVVLEGKLHEKVTVEECVWHLDDNRIVISLEKQRQTWWKCVLEGDQEIDTTKVESTRTMDEYDGETQGAIRKIMFDQNQKAKGQPTSDQIRTADIMKDAWNAPGSPFRGSEFDPTLLNLSGPVPDDFFSTVDQKRMDEARAKKDAETAVNTSASSQSG